MGSFGKGMGYHAAAGYEFPCHFGIQAGADYRPSGYYSLTDTLSPGNIQSVSITVRAFHLVPALSFHVEKNRWAFAVAEGLAIGIGNRYQYDYKSEYTYC